MLNIFGYQVCVIQVRVINISFGSISLSVLLGTFGIMQNGGKPYKNLCAQFCWNASVEWLWRSGFHAMQVGIWCDRQNANKSISGNPLFGELSENHHDLASTERSPNCFEIPILLLHSTCLGGRYPAAIVIPQFKRYSEISLATSTISRLWMSVLLVLLLITLEY